ncbi:molybdenum ABC transporter ATP-binding protein [Lacimicrobium sp. SS2-24]|uniref:molybdenum ABC transporter ATP-binding protein n=1 Tax=Lacimicrobium sp. SS2-24 TaxID=2005569 RepID=UPI001FF07212|nr:molybdenum ABC transporter ATP-binding protein [Lacimicrobium sp. SS2-24]
MTSIGTRDGLIVQLDMQYKKQHHENFSLRVALTLPGSGITGILGPSGSGKTTLLRCIAGLEQPHDGLVMVNGQRWQDKDNVVPTHDRPLGYVFQEASLFPHLSAKGNLEFALKRATSSAASIAYDKVLEVMGIERLLGRYPTELSGGERQRVAIARALLIQPQLLLMDEPLSSLDDARKHEILPYLEDIRQSFDIPILYVSHSMEEIARLADYVVVMENGQAIAQGPLNEVFTRMDLPLAMDDQTGVVWQGEIIEHDSTWQLARIRCAGGELWIRDGGDRIGDRVRVRVLAKDVSLSLGCHTDSSILNRVAVTVSQLGPDQDSAMQLVKLKAAEDYIIARLTRRSVAHLKLEPGLNLWAQIKSVAIVQ